MIFNTVYTVDKTSNLGEISIIDDGIYLPATYNLDGFSKVTVNTGARIDLHDYIINNLHAFYPQGGGFIYYPSDSTYWLGCTVVDLIMRIYLKASATRTSGLTYHFDILSNNGGRSMYNMRSSVQNFYPTFESYMDGVNWFGYPGEWSDETQQNFYNVNSWIYNLSSSNLPIVKQTFDNERQSKIKDLFETTLKVKDLYQITTQNVAGVILLYLPSWEGSLSLLWVQDLSNGVYFNTSNNIFYIRPNFWWYNIGGNKLNSIQQLSGNYRDRSYSYSVTLEQLTEATVLNTYDIKDQNGNTVISANCTLAEFGL